MINRFAVICILFSSVLASHAAGLEDDTKCALSSASNGQVLTIRGRVMHEPHDMAFDIPGCSETVLLTYAGYQDNDVSVTELRRDENMKRFHKYTYSTYKSRGKNICIGCSKYGDVDAELTGRLEIATMPPGATKDKPGYIRDPSGKIIGVFGWGHPTPYAGYRLIIESVSQVKARKLPRP
jgi:hypothetical protein